MRETLLDKLQAEYRDYCHVNGLPQVSADEQQFEKLERVQRRWIYKFLEIWEIAQIMEELR